MLLFPFERRHRRRGPEEHGRTGELAILQLNSISSCRACVPACLSQVCLCFARACMRAGAHQSAVVRTCGGCIPCALAAFAFQLPLHAKHAFLLAKCDSQAARVVGPPHLASADGGGSDHASHWLTVTRTWSQHFHSAWHANLQILFGTFLLLDLDELQQRLVHHVAEKALVLLHLHGGRRGAARICAGAQRERARLQPGQGRAGRKGRRPACVHESGGVSTTGAQRPEASPKHACAGKGGWFWRVPPWAAAPAPARAQHRALRAGSHLVVWPARQRAARIRPAPAPDRRPIGGRAMMGFRFVTPFRVDGLCPLRSLRAQQDSCLTTRP